MSLHRCFVEMLITTHLMLTLSHPQSKLSMSDSIPKFVEGTVL